MFKSNGLGRYIERYAAQDSADNENDWDKCLGKI